MLQLSCVDWKVTGSRRAGKGRFAITEIFLPVLAWMHALSQRNYNFSSRETVDLQFARRSKDRGGIQFPASGDLIIFGGWS